MGFKCGSCHRRQPGAYYSGGVGEGVNVETDRGGGGFCQCSYCLGSGRGGMMYTADRPARKFLGKGEEAPSSGR